MAKPNEHLQYICENLENISMELQRELRILYPDIHERVYSPLFTISYRIDRLRDYVAHLKAEEPQMPLKKPCVDCGEEEANPGLDVCGPCYNKRIWGENS